MANRPASAVAFVLSMLLSCLTFFSLTFFNLTFFLGLTLLLSLTSAQAADPGFCRQYAKAALNQMRGGLSSPACASGLQGARWSTDFAVHYEWCLGVSSGTADVERDARTQYLKGCAGR